MCHMHNHFLADLAALDCCTAKMGFLLFLQLSMLDQNVVCVVGCENTHTHEPVLGPR